MQMLDAASHAVKACELTRRVGQPRVCVCVRVCVRFWPTLRVCVCVRFWPTLLSRNDAILSRACKCTVLCGAHHAYTRTRTHMRAHTHTCAHTKTHTHAHTCTRQATPILTSGLPGAGWNSRMPTSSAHASCLMRPPLCLPDTRPLGTNGATLKNRRASTGERGTCG